MAQVKPEILDVINGDETVRQIADINGTNPKIINSPEIVQKIRQQRAEMQAKVQQMEMLKTGAETAEKATKAEKNLKEGR
jgi:hypothetical protein